MIYKNKETETTRFFETKNDRVIATIKINGRWVSNPTIAEFEAEGWEEYTEPEQEPYKPTYAELVVNKIRERYTIDDELSLLRQRDIKPLEFAEYDTYCEQCKVEAKEELNS